MLFRSLPVDQPFSSRLVGKFRPIFKASPRVPSPAEAPCPPRAGSAPPTYPLGPMTHICVTQPPRWRLLQGRAWLRHLCVLAPAIISGKTLRNRPLEKRERRRPQTLGPRNSFRGGDASNSSSSHPGWCSRWVPGTSSALVNDRR